MSIYDIIHFIFGSYEIGLENRFEEFITLLSGKRVNFWGIKKSDSGGTLKTSVFAGETVMKLAEHGGFDATVLKRRGIPFVFNKYRMRLGLFLGLICGLLMLFFSQFFVWKITVSGNTAVSASELLECLSDYGIKVGSYIPKIDPDHDANAILLLFPKLSSIAINLEGTHLEIVVLERTPVPEAENDKGFFNVVALRDGIILDVSAADGTPEVKAGDVVTQGQLLINSFIEGRNGTFRPTHARGYVYAAVSEPFQAVIPLNQIRKSYTGNTESKRTLKVLGRDVDLFISENSPYEYFDATVTKREKKLFGFIELPVTETVVTYCEYRPSEVRISGAEAETLAREALKLHLDEVGGELISCETEAVFDEKNGTCTLLADAVIKMDIAVESELIFRSDQKIFESLPKAPE